MGPTDLKVKDIQKVLLLLSEKYTGNNYHCVLQNCNHFTDELCYILTERHIPAWINRLARIGQCFPIDVCL